ncbi:MAG: transporter substrate-binding domain-containing protein [Magnetococcales bacterium]|nr:transporter substrate-binding domain-containing protein [Magnetococcales bacterium]
MKSLAACLLLIGVSLFLSPLSHASSLGELSLSPDEKKWIADHPVIRVANENDWPPFDFAEEGVEKGYSIDLVKLIGQKTGLTFQFINGHTWKELLQMGLERQIDLFPAIWKNQEREAHFAFTSPYMDTPHILLVRERETGIQRIEDLINRQLVSVKGYATTELVKKHYPGIQVLEVDTPSEGLRLVAYGQVDAYLGTLGSTIYQIRQRMIHGLKVAGETDIGGHLTIENLHIAVRNDWPTLKTLIDKGLQSVTVEERLALQDKWISIPGPNAKLRIPLTPAEKGWISQNKALLFRTSSRKPLAFVEGNHLEGILGDYLTYFREAVGVDLTLGSPLGNTENPWVDQTKPVDFWLVLDGELSTGQPSAFSQPLLQMPLAIITRRLVGFIEDIHLVAQESLAVARASGIVAFLKKHHPQLNLIEVDDTEACLQRVAQRLAFGCIDLAPSAQYHLGSGAYDDLKISGMTSEKIGLSMVVPEHHVILAEVFNKVLLSMPTAKREAIYHSWVRIRVREKIDYTLVSWIAGGFALLLLMALLWNQTLRQQVQRRRQAEIRLQELADRQKAVLDHSPVGIAFLDQDRVIRQANPTMARIFGAETTVMVGRTTQDFFHDEEAFKRLGERAYPVLRTGAVFEEELLLQRLNGERFWCHLRGVAINKDHIDEGFVWTTEEITARREIKDRLQQAKDAAESANRSKTLFLAHMSHEIRTPLNAILGMNEILLESDLSAEQRHYMQTLKNAGETLLALINDVLDLSKIEAGQMDLTLIDFNLPKLVENTAGLQRLTAREKEISFRVELGSGLPRHVRGDPDRLRQVLLNLLNNAIKFTHLGQVTVTVHQEANQVIRFAISDTGIGMTEAQIDRIFKPFVQADTTTTRHFGGTGLGLTICKRLVEAMGGEIGVESRLGQGSTFHVTLPLPSSKLHGHRESLDPEEQPTASPHSQSTKEQLHILLVDDAVENRLVISAFLKKSPHRLVQAVNGAEAVEAFEKERFDLILMDMRMPVMDGYEATRTIRQMEKTANLKPIPIIALTAQALKEDLGRTLEAGCDYHLTKPVRKIHLLEVIDRYRAPPI